MLSQHANKVILRSSSASSSILRRAIVVECARAVAEASPLHSHSTTTLHSSSGTRYYSSTCRLSSSTTTASTLTKTNRPTGTGTRQRRGVVDAPPLRQHRPVVNGETVAFHINDLLNNNSKPTLVAKSGAARRSSAEAVQRQPQTTRSYDSDLIVVLDMDECLIHSQFLSTPGAAQVYAHQLKQKRRNQTSNGGEVDSFRFSLPDGDLVHVNIRPGLHEFLQAVTSKFETHVFTAAMDIYAKPLLDHLDPSGDMFAGRWYREHCSFDAQQQAYVKDLGRLPTLGNDLDRVVLVDNNPLSFLANPSNGILVSSFYSDPADSTLSNVWQLLQELDEKDEDVRPHLEERFGLKQALQEIRQTSKTL